MYQYQYVPVEFKRGVFKDILEQHRQIIDKYASEGWRFVTAVPTKIVGYGAVTMLDLVFEKEKEKE